jgi:hypothetical protein
MAELRPANRVQQVYIEKMGPELGTLQFKLFNQCAWLYVKWLDFVVLYGNDAETIAVLNQSAHSYFHMLQEVLFEDAILHICRLSDPAIVAGRTTVSVNGLMRAHFPDQLKNELGTCLADVRQKTEFARDWRNRHIGHHDYELATGGSKPLESASRKRVRLAIDSIAAAINCVETHYCGGPVLYDTVGPQIAGATKLLQILRKGVQAN